MEKYLYSIVNSNGVLGLYRNDSSSAKLGLVGEKCCANYRCWSNSFPEHYNPDVLTTCDREIVEQFEDPEKAKEWIRNNRSIDPNSWFNNPAIDLVAVEKNKSNHKENKKVYHKQVKLINEITISNNLATGQPISFVTKKNAKNICKERNSSSLMMKKEMAVK